MPSAILCVVIALLALSSSTFISTTHGQSTTGGFIDSGGGDGDYDADKYSGLDYVEFPEYGITLEQGKDAGKAMSALVGVMISAGVIVNAVIPPQPSPPVPTTVDPMTLINYAQYIVTLGLLSGHQPPFVRMFAGQFAYVM